MNYLLVLDQLVSLRFQCLDLLLHLVHFFFVLLHVLGVSVLDLGYDVLIACDSRRHLFLKLVKLAFISRCLLFLGLQRMDLKVQIVFHKLKLQENIRKLIFVLVFLGLALDAEPLGRVVAVASYDLALVLVLYVVDNLRVYKIALSGKTLYG